MATTTRRDKLARLGTTELIDQYSAAISSYAGRYSNCAPRQKRIDYIVDLLSQRADVGDATALTWYEES